jgi:predicted nucleic acid-binding protein
VNLYVESSAVLAWLLGEPAATTVREFLQESESVASSDLTLVECERALIRAVTAGEIVEAAAADRSARLSVAAMRWRFWRLDSEIIARARKPFPAEPIRTLDALHLASALRARATTPGLELLSLDDRIRRAGKQLGFRVRP